jgi:hypothetical protein
MTRVPAWRIAAAAAVLGIIVVILAVCAPYYFRNRTLQNYVADLTRRVDIREQPDAGIRRVVLQRAEQLGLPVTEANVRINRAEDGTLRQIDVRYMVPIELPGYTVKLHFYPGAGSR